MNTEEHGDKDELVMDRKKENYKVEENHEKGKFHIGNDSKKYEKSVSKYLPLTIYDLPFI